MGLSTSESTAWVHPDIKDRALLAPGFTSQDSLTTSSSRPRLPNQPKATDASSHLSPSVRRKPSHNGIVYQEESQKSNALPFYSFTFNKQQSPGYQRATNSSSVTGLHCLCGFSSCCQFCLKCSSNAPCPALPVNLRNCPLGCQDSAEPSHAPGGLWHAFPMSTPLCLQSPLHISPSQSPSPRLWSWPSSWLGFRAL